MDIGRILSTIPPIVEAIFKHLKLRDLESCSAVCELWQRVAETEKNSREDVSWFFQAVECVDHSSLQDECTSKKVENFERGLTAQLTEKKRNPYFCLMFVTEELICDFETYFPSFVHPQSKAKRARHEDFSRSRLFVRNAMKTAVTQYLPEKCKTHFIISPGIIGCLPDVKPLELENGYAISGLMIPDTSGLEIYNIAVDEKQCNVSELVPENSSMKCLLVFATNSDYYLNTMIRQCLERENFKLAVGGAIVSRAESLRGSVVAFCGESVEAASVILKRSDGVPEVEKKLKTFQQTGLLNDRCFAFMFVCVARGASYYDALNFESSAFHKLYPTVPIFGVYGNGEIGVDFLPGDPAKSSVSKRRQRYFYGYTTVFVLVSVKL